MPPPDSGSRYARQPTIVVVAPDGTPRTMSAPRVAPAPATAGSHEVRAGDRLDLLALAATGDTTQWWRLADANPWGDATRLEEPGRRIALPGA